MSYVTIYDLGEHLEATVLPFQPTRREKPTSNLRLYSPPTTDEESLDREIEYIAEETDKEKKKQVNKERSLARTKVLIRRYVKRYKLTKMYTFTFAENMPLSKMAEQCGKWNTRIYKGKIRRVWQWDKKPKGERIQNNIHYNRQGKATDLTTSHGAWFLWKKFIRRMQSSGIAFNYLVVAEKQKRGVYHFHVATDSIPTASISDLWLYGFIGKPNAKMKNEIHAYRYVTKYITKEVNVATEEGERHFRRSGTFELPKRQILLDCEVDRVLEYLVDSLTTNGININDIKIFTNQDMNLLSEFCIFHIEGTKENE